MNNMSDKTIKKQFHAAHQHLINQGIDPTDIAREQRHELMVPKLALVGVFQTLETFCAAGKTNVMSTVGPLNTRNLLLFFGALKKSVELGERLLVEYQGAQASMKAMEHAVAVAEQEATSQEEEEEENNQINQDIEDDQEKTENDDDNTDDDNDDDQSEFLKTFDIRKLN
jgi:hypothetical protein